MEEHEVDLSTVCQYLPAKNQDAQPSDRNTTALEPGYFKAVIKEWAKYASEMMSVDETQSDHTHDTICLLRGRTVVQNIINKLRHNGLQDNYEGLQDNYEGNMFEWTWLLKELTRLVKIYQLGSRTQHFVKTMVYKQTEQPVCESHPKPIVQINIRDLALEETQQTVTHSDKNPCHQSMLPYKGDKDIGIGDLPDLLTANDKLSTGLLMARCPKDLGPNMREHGQYPQSVRPQAEFVQPHLNEGNETRQMVAGDLFMNTPSSPRYLRGSDIDPTTPWLRQKAVFTNQAKFTPSFEHKSVPGHIPTFTFGGHERSFYTHPLGQMVDRHRPTGLTVPYVRAYSIPPTSIAPQDPSAGQMYNAPVHPLAKVMLFSLHGSAIDPTTVVEDTFKRHSELLMQFVPREDGVRDPLYYTPDMAKAIMIGNGRLHCKSRDLAFHDMTMITLCPPGEPAAVRVSFNHFDAAIMLKVILDRLTNSRVAGIHMDTYTPSVTNRKTNKALRCAHTSAKSKYMYRSKMYSNALAYTPSCVAKDVNNYSLATQPVCSRVSIAMTDGSVFQILAGHMVKEYSNYDLIPEAQLLFGHETLSGDRLGNDQLLIWNNNVDFHNIWEQSFNKRLGPQNIEHSILWEQSGLGKAGTSLAALEFILYDKVSDMISANWYSEKAFKEALEDSPEMVRQVTNKNVTNALGKIAEVPDPLMFYVDYDKFGDSVDLAACRETDHPTPRLRQNKASSSAMGVLHTAIMNFQMIVQYDNTEGKFISHRVGMARQSVLEMIDQGHTAQYHREMLHDMMKHVYYLEHTAEQVTTEDFDLIGRIRGMMIVDARDMRRAIYNSQMRRNSNNDKLLSKNDIQTIALRNAQELRTNLLTLIIQFIMEKRDGLNMVAPSYERQDPEYTGRPSFTWYSLADQCARHMFQYNQLMNTNPELPIPMSNYRIISAPGRRERFDRILMLNEYRARAINNDVLATEFPKHETLVSGLELGTLSSCTPDFVMHTRYTKLIIIDGYSNVFLHAAQLYHVHISNSVQLFVGERNYDRHKMIGPTNYREHLEACLYWQPTDVPGELSSASDSTSDSDADDLDSDNEVIKEPSQGIITSQIDSPQNVCPSTANQNNPPTETQTDPPQEAPSNSSANNQPSITTPQTDNIPIENPLTDSEDGSDSDEDTPRCERRMIDINGLGPRYNPHLRKKCQTQPCYKSTRYFSHNPRCMLPEGHTLDGPNDKLIPKRSKASTSASVPKCHDDPTADKFPSAPEEPVAKRQRTRHTHQCWEPYEYDIKDIPAHQKMSIIMKRNEKRDRIKLVMRHQKYHSNTYERYPQVLQQYGDKWYPRTDEIDAKQTPVGHNDVECNQQRELQWAIGASRHNIPAVQKCMEGNRFIAFNAASEKLQARYCEFRDVMNVMTSPNYQTVWKTQNPMVIRVLEISRTLPYNLLSRVNVTSSHDSNAVESLACLFSYTHAMPETLEIRTLTLRRIIQAYREVSNSLDQFKQLFTIPEDVDQDRLCIHWTSETDNHAPCSSTKRDRIPQTNMNDHVPNNTNEALPSTSKPIGQTETSTSVLQVQHPTDGTCLKGRTVELSTLLQETSQLNSLISHPQHLLETLLLSTSPRSKELILYLCDHMECTLEELETKSKRHIVAHVQYYVTYVLGALMATVGAPKEKSAGVAPEVVYDEWSNCVLDAARFMDFRELSADPQLLYKRLTPAQAPHMLKFGDAMAARLNCDTFLSISLQNKEDVAAACEQYIKQCILTRQPNVSNVSPAQYNVDNSMRDPTPFAFPVAPDVSVPRE